MKRIQFLAEDSMEEMKAALPAMLLAGAVYLVSGIFTSLTGIHLPDSIDAKDYFL